MVTTPRFLIILSALVLAAPSLAAVRFVALGDAGEGNFEQYQVGAAMQRICAQKGCDFAIYLGDNFYDTGVSSVTDRQFQSKFEQPYAGLDFPFYVALGNHDYGSSALEFWRSWHQILYTYEHPASKWQLPWFYHQHQIDNVAIFILNTQSILVGRTFDEQKAWLDRQLAASNAQWKIVAGHHPYLSNGEHGNAGNYEGCPFCPIVNGRKMQKFVEQAVCGKADYYFSGHDHNLQWLEPRCGTGFIVAGAGSKTTALQYRDGNPMFFDYDSTPGFMWIEIDGDQLTGKLYDLYGNELFTRVERK